jgi:hypothetical protein
VVAMRTEAAPTIMVSMQSQGGGRRSGWRDHGGRDRGGFDGGWQDHCGFGGQESRSWWV